MTNTASALEMAANMFRQNGGRQGVPHVAIVVTDGKLFLYYNIPFFNLESVCNYTVFLPFILKCFYTGVSNVNAQSTIPQAIQLRAAGTQVITVSVGKAVNSLELRGMASRPHDRMMFNTRSLQGLNSLLSQVTAATCNGKYIIHV